MSENFENPKLDGLSKIGQSRKEFENC